MLPGFHHRIPLPHVDLRSTEQVLTREDQPRLSAKYEVQKLL